MAVIFGLPGPEKNLKVEFEHKLFKKKQILEKRK